MSDIVRAWHFVGNTLRDGRPVPPDGEWLAHDGPVEMCESGLHASLNPYDALRYAPGAVLCRVECAAVGERETDKLVCRRRRIVTRRDMTVALLAYARDEASRVLHLWDAPEVVRQWLATGDESLRSAAWWAAWSAARSAESAARSAESAAGWAAGSAAWLAAWSAARSAESAAGLAAWSAARSAESAAGWAAGSAWWAARSAESAARSAESAAGLAESEARSASSDRFRALVAHEFGLSVDEVTP